MHKTVTSQSQEMIDLVEPNAETLIADERSNVSPSEQVERKLVALLDSATLPVSQLHQVPQLCRKHSGTS